MSKLTESKEKIMVDVMRPALYKVILLNDDYSTMEFVIEILMSLFHKNATEATKIMLDVHEKGKGLVGLYPYDIALTKVIQVEEAAKARQFPLIAVMEAE